MRLHVPLKRVTQQSPRTLLASVVFFVALVECRTRMAIPDHHERAWQSQVRDLELQLDLLDQGCQDVAPKASGAHRIVVVGESSAEMLASLLSRCATGRV